MLDGTDRTDAPEASALPELAPRAAGPRILDVDLRGVDLSDRAAVRAAIQRAQPLPPGPERDRALAALADVRSAPGAGTVRTQAEQMAHLRRLHGRG